MSIKRYGLLAGGYTEEDPEGTLVEYEDHLRVIADLTKDERFEGRCPTCGQRDMSPAEPMPGRRTVRTVLVEHLVRHGTSQEAAETLIENMLHQECTALIEQNHRLVARIDELKADDDGRFTIKRVVRLRCSDHQGRVGERCPNCEPEG